MTLLPRETAHVGVPPIKCQGIKTKLVPFLFQSVKWNPGDNGRWIEPFLGSGCVAFNLAPDRALLQDTNRHIIGFYKAIQAGEISRTVIEDFLNEEGKRLAAGGQEYYYEVRSRFNELGSPLDFLFLNRSCFNGVMRFNRKGGFNVPFGHKPERFAKAYITKIANQIGWVSKQMYGKDWVFRVAPWQEGLSEAATDDFVYMDPPYIGRHADYFNAWDQDEAEQLATYAKKLPCGFALSMWLENRYRKNEHIEYCWSEMQLRVCSHFYHVGSDEALRNEIDEALLIKPGYATEDQGKQATRKRVEVNPQLTMALERSSQYVVEAVV
jgi:DNA adenine methylase